MNLEAHLSPEFIERCQAHLVELKCELLEKMRQIQSDLQELEFNPSEEVDQSNRMTTEHHLLVNNRRVRSLLLEIELALMRIQNGTYGICEETGEPIEPERLLIIPYTRLSAEGAEIRDEKIRQLG